MAGQHVHALTRTFTAGEELLIHRRVKLTGDYTVQYADAGEAGIGTVSAAKDNTQKVAIVLHGGMGTRTMVANGSITQNDLVYPAADGKVTSTVTGAALGRALEAASSDGDWIEVLPNEQELFSDAAATHGFFEDFLYYSSGETLTTTASNSGTATVSDAVGGILAIAASDSSAADNDETYVHSTTETFKFANNKPLWFEARVALTEANTDDANVLVGLMESVAANSLGDDAGGPEADYDGAVFYKIDGGTTWLAEVSNGTTQTAVTLTGASFPGDGTYQKLKIEFIPTGATSSEVNFYIDGTLVGTASAWDYSSTNEMEAVVGVKNGDTNGETLNVDYITCKQVR